MVLLVNLKPVSGRGPARAKARGDGLTAAGITRCGDDEASVRCSGEESLRSTLVARAAISMRHSSLQAKRNRGSTEIISKCQIRGTPAGV